MKRKDLFVYDPHLNKIRTCLPGKGGPRSTPQDRFLVRLASILVHSFPDLFRPTPVFAQLFGRLAQCRVRQSESRCQVYACDVEKSTSQENEVYCHSGKSTDCAHLGNVSGNRVGREYFLPPQRLR